VKPYYEDDLVTIYHADCRDVLPSLAVDLVLTDPPYAFGARREEWSATASVAIGLQTAAAQVRKRGALIAFTTSSGRGLQYTIESVARTLPLNRILTWQKDRARGFAISPWRWDTISVLMFGTSPTGGVAPASSVFLSPAHYPRPSGHPAELPDGIAEWLYKPFDRPGVVVVDPFMGTGRLLEPAAKAGRRVIGIEIEERYCEIAAARLSQGTLVLTA
jgi:site-specific DNA-methyltransferase (adenine-specific)